MAKAEWGCDQSNTFFQGQYQCWTLTGVAVNHFCPNDTATWFVVDVLQPWLQVSVCITHFVNDIEEELAGLLPLTLHQLQDFTHLKETEKLFIWATLTKVAGSLTLSGLVGIRWTISTSSWQKKPFSSRLCSRHWMLVIVDTSSSLWRVSRWRHGTLDSSIRATVAVEQSLLQNQNTTSHLTANPGHARCHRKAAKEASNGGGRLMIWAVSNCRNHAH